MRMDTSKIRPFHRLTRMLLRYSLAVSFIFAFASQFKWFEVVQVTPFALFSLASDQYGAVLTFRAYQPGMAFWNDSGTGTYDFPKEHPVYYSQKHFSQKEMYRSAVLLPGIACWKPLPGALTGNTHAVFVDHMWIIAVTACFSVAAHWNVGRSMLLTNSFEPTAVS